MQDNQDDWSKAGKKQLLDKLLPTLEEIERLRESVARLLRRQGTPPPLRHAEREDDFVPGGWVEQHRIEIPRADGIFESDGAWVRVKHGSIVGAGLKNQSILSLMVSLDLLDQGAEYHGNLYKDWRAAFFSRLDPGTSGGKGSEDPDAWSKEDHYSKLIHRIDHDHISAMDAIVASKPKARHLAAFHGPKNATKEEVDKAQGVFVAAFLTVAKAMAEVNREAAEANAKIKSQ